jgi:hypothetical protein
MKRASVLRVLGLAAAALLVEGWLTSDHALATCGDYVMVGGHGHGADHGLPGVPTCHGPNCHQQAPLPALPTKGLTTAPPVDFAFWSQTIRSTRPPVCGEIVELGLLLSEGHSLPLLRPPCL